MCNVQEWLGNNGTFVGPYGGLAASDGVFYHHVWAFKSLAEAVRAIRKIEIRGASAIAYNWCPVQQPNGLERIRGRTPEHRILVRYN